MNIIIDSSCEEKILVYVISPHTVREPVLLNISGLYSVGEVAQAAIAKLDKAKLLVHAVTAVDVSISVVSCNFSQGVSTRFESRRALSNREKFDAHLCDESCVLVEFNDNEKGFQSPRFEPHLSKAALLTDTSSRVYNSRINSTSNQNLFLEESVKPSTACVGEGSSQICWPQPKIPYRLLFHSNQLGMRGTEVALFDYAHFFELFCAGISYIASTAGGGRESLSKFETRFPGRVYLIGGNVSFYSLAIFLKLDGIYTIQARNTFEFEVPESLGLQLLVHGVFSGMDGRHTRSGMISSAVISPTVPHLPSIPVVNHMVDKFPFSKRNMRKELNISKDAKVFCRHGGFGTFDIQEARTVGTFLRSWLFLRHSLIGRRLVLDAVKYYANSP